MPQPTVASVHVDQLLTNISVSYQNTNYIADQLFPIVGVSKQSGLIGQYPQSFWFRNDAKKRAPGTIAAGGGYTVDTSARYYCDNYAFSKDIPDEIRANYDNPFEPDREASEFVTDKLLLQREVAFATDFFTTSVWGQDKTGGTDFTVWSNYAGSNPNTDVESWRDSVELKIGREPNVMAIGKSVLVQALWHPDVVDSIKYTQTGIASEDLLRSLFKVSKLLVGRAIQTTDKEGTAEASVTYARVWGKHALLMYVPDRPALMTPSAGYTFVWQPTGGLNAVYRHREDRMRKDVIEAASFYDQKAIGTNAGLFASGVVA